MIYHVCFVYLLTRSTWTLSDVTMMRPQKWRRIMSTYCQTNVSLIKDYVPVRIIGIITVTQAFETMIKIFINTMGKLSVTAVLEIVCNSSCIPRQLRTNTISDRVHRSLKCSLVNIRKN